MEVPLILRKVKILLHNVYKMHYLKKKHPGTWKIKELKKKDMSGKCHPIKSW